ncbi:MAG: tetratricopeptide repeat protein, partial [Bacteroidales bacterium]|nr:tetratricopeptide repeat protein [Bacteroidales bacterium]
MVRLFFFLILFLFSFEKILHSQNPTIDSLKLQLNVTEGEEKIKTLIGLSYNYLRISTDSSLKYSNQALDYSKETDNQRGIARAMLMIGSGHNATGVYSLAIESQLYALDIFEELGDSSAIGITYNNLGTNYHNLGNYTEAIKQYQNSIMIATRI